MGPWRFPILTFALVGLRLVVANHALIWGVMSLSGGPYQHVAGILLFMRRVLVPPTPWTHESRICGIPVDPMTVWGLHAMQDLIPRAWVLGQYPNSSTTFRTPLASRGSTVGMPLRARDAVAVETRARFAISWRFIESLLLLERRDNSH
jgi:hypothetical protein